MTTEDQARSRRRTVEVLEELQSVGLLTLELEHRDWHGSNPHVEITARRENLSKPAPRNVSLRAALVWDLLRSGKLREACERGGIVKLGSTQLVSHGQDKKAADSKDKNLNCATSGVSNEQDVVIQPRSFAKKA